MGFNTKVVSVCDCCGLTVENIFKPGEIRLPKDWRIVDLGKHCFTSEDLFREFFGKEPSEEDAGDIRYWLACAECWDRFMKAAKAAGDERGHG